MPRCSPVRRPVAAFRAVGIAVLAFAPIATGVCYNLTGYTFAQGPLPSCSPCERCEDGDACRVGTAMLDCGIAVVRVRLCAPFICVLNGAGTACVSLGAPIGPWAADPSGEVIISYPGGPPCNTLPGGGGGEN